LNFSKGGFQSARGSQNGGEFYLENLVEELDFATEFFHDTETDVRSPTTNLNPIEKAIEKHDAMPWFTLKARKQSTVGGSL